MSWRLDEVVTLDLTVLQRLQPRRVVRDRLEISVLSFAFVPQ